MIKEYFHFKNTGILPAGFLKELMNKITNENF
jgi:hypothetical protein